MSEERALLLEIWQQALAAVDGRGCVRAALADVPAGDPWQVIAIGKAAGAMTLGALDALGAQVAHALAISRSGHFPAELESKAQVERRVAGHPLPDMRSLAAGGRVLELLASLPRDRRILFLISGGSSSLVEVLPDGVSLADLRRVNDWALASGYDIAAINSIRKRLSLIKGGGLLDYVAGREVLALLISDVPGDDPNLIGSGLVGERVLERLPTGLPPWLNELVARRATASDPAATPAVRRRVIATLEDALAAAEAAGRAAGLATHRASRRFAGDAVELATRFCHELKMGPGGLRIWGGESTVRLPARPGRGGRNQHLALAAARLLVSHEELTLLAAGTDGSDGSTADAGAIVDSETVERGTVSGLDVDDCLVRADSGAFLEASGDLVHSGPTGTNVGDLVLGIKRV